MNAVIQRRHHQGMIHIFSIVVCSLLAALLASFWKVESKNTVPGQIGFPSVYAVREARVPKLG